MGKTVTHFERLYENAAATDPGAVRETASYDRFIYLIHTLDAVVQIEISPDGTDWYEVARYDDLGGDQMHIFETDKMVGKARVNIESIGPSPDVTVDLVKRMD